MLRRISNIRVPSKACRGNKLNIISFNDFLSKNNNY